MVTAHKNQVIDTWKSKESDNFSYFSQVENHAATDGFWRPDGYFRQLFDRLDLTNVLEIACGFGRHGARIAARCGHLTLIDTSVDAVAYAKKRFEDRANVTVLLSQDGMTLPSEMSGLTSVFSYDAMVHFEPLTMASYLSEIGRVLAPGGKAVLHHSNYSKNPTGQFKENPNWRNYMTADLFKHLSSRAGLHVDVQYFMSWGDEPNSDAVSLLSKAS